MIRSKDIEASGFNGTAAFMEVRVQSIVVEFVLTHVPQLFPLEGLEKHSDIPHIQTPASSLHSPSFRRTDREEEVPPLAVSAAQSGTCVLQVVGFSA